MPSSVRLAAFGFALLFAFSCASLVFISTPSHVGRKIVCSLLSTPAFDDRIQQLTSILEDFVESSNSVPMLRSLTAPLTEVAKGVLESLDAVMGSLFCREIVILEMGLAIVVFVTGLGMAWFMCKANLEMVPKPKAD
jgi:hypothetical protein